MVHLKVSSGMWDRQEQRDLYTNPTLDAARASAWLVHTIIEDLDYQAAYVLQCVYTIASIIYSGAHGGEKSEPLCS